MSRQGGSPHPRYLLTAAGLGLGWFPVLLVPGITREWLLEDPAQNLVWLAAASLLVAVPMRGFVVGAGTFPAHLARAVVMPLLGCLVYLTLWVVSLGAGTLARGQGINLHDTGSLYAMGFTAALVSAHLVVPYALACQYALHAAGRSRAA